jgi:hypothetical protein
VIREVAVGLSTYAGGAGIGSGGGGGGYQRWDTVTSSERSGSRSTGTLARPGQQDYDHTHYIWSAARVQSGTPQRYERGNRELRAAATAAVSPGYGQQGAPPLLLSIPLLQNGNATSPDGQVYYNRKIGCHGGKKPAAGLP